MGAIFACTTISLALKQERLTFDLSGRSGARGDPLKAGSGSRDVEMVPKPVPNVPLATTVVGGICVGITPDWSTG